MMTALLIYIAATYLIAVVGTAHAARKYAAIKWRKAVLAILFAPVVVPVWLVMPAPGMRR